MSDHRFSLDAKLTIYGQTFEWNPWLNWVADGDSGVDQRIIDWFANCYAKARSGYDTYAEMHQAEENERDDREQLARLKAKYESGQSPTETPK